MTNHQSESLRPETGCVLSTEGRSQCVWASVVNGFSIWTCGPGFDACGQFQHGYVNSIVSLSRTGVSVCLTLNTHLLHFHGLWL